MRVFVNVPDGKLHSTSWVYPWIEYLQLNKIEYVEIDITKCNPIDIIQDYDVFLWHFSQYNYIDMLEARNIIYSLKLKNPNLKVFPDFNDAWHFDDKVAEMYALKAVGAPIPNSWVFYDVDTLKNAISNKEIIFPIIAKLRTGSGSHNVRKIENKKQLISYAKRMFGKGYNPSPSLLYKTTSNIRSSHDKATFFSKLKRVPEFLRVLKESQKFPHEKGYVYLQEFIPNDGFDMKVVVVKDKLSGLYRPIRSHDFRASGGGEVKYKKDLLTDDIINSAFSVSDSLGFQCVGFDYVIDNRTGKGVIIEMSYGFSHVAIMGMNGWYDRNKQWHDGALNAPYEILKNIVKQSRSEK